MTALFIIAVLFVGAAIVLFVRALALPHLRMATHLRQIETYGFHSALASDEPRGARPPLGWTVNATAESVGRLAIARVGALKPLPRGDLTSAGFYTLSPEAFHVAWEAGYAGVCSAYGGYNFPGDDPFHLRRFHADCEFIRFKNWLTIDPRKLRMQCDFDPGAFQANFREGSRRGAEDAEGKCETVNLIA